MFAMSFCMKVSPVPSSLLVSTEEYKYFKNDLCPKKNISSNIFVVDIEYKVGYPLDQKKQQGFFLDYRR
jgi:hypothetical protein